MDKTTIAKIISAAAGLSLVGLGAWLLQTDHGDHGGMLILAGVGLIGGGLGTAFAPRLGEPRRTTPIEEQRRARRSGSSGPLAMLVALVISATAATTSACGGPPHAAYVGVEQAAEGLDQADIVLASEVQERGPEARAQVLREVAAGAIESIDAGLDRFEELLAPTTIARTVVRTARRAVRATEAALDAWAAGADEGQGFFASAACGVAALLEVAEAFDAAGVELPDELTGALAMIAGFAQGACPAPEVGHVDGE